MNIEYYECLGSERILWLPRIRYHLRSNLRGTWLGWICRLFLPETKYQVQNPLARANSTLAERTKINRSRTWDVRRSTVKWPQPHHQPPLSWQPKKTLAALDDMPTFFPSMSPTKELHEIASTNQAAKAGRLSSPRHNIKQAAGAKRSSKDRKIWYPPGWPPSCRILAIACKCQVLFSSCFWLLESRINISNEL